jgi:PEP-CTERM motif
MKARYLFLSVLAAAALPIPAADASVLLIFGQTGLGDTVTGTRTGSSTTITSSTSVDIDEIDAASIMTPISATFTLSATNSGPATTSGGEITQHYNGTFSITSGATNFLSGTFSDAVFGSGGALTLSASNPSPTQSVSFTSNVIAPDLITAFDRAASLSFTDVSPTARIVAGTLGSFTSDVSGDFSSTVPEPSTWALMLLGFAGLGYVGFRKARARSAISIA